MQNVRCRGRLRLLDENSTRSVALSIDTVLAGELYVVRGCIARR